MFKPTFLLTEKERHEVSQMSGEIIRWILEGRGIWYMSEKLNMPPQEVESNICEMLYVLRKEVGIWRYLRILFWK